MSEQKRRPLVVDTSVAVKFYVPEEDRESALRLLSASRSGEVELLAPGTLLAEGFNAVWQQHRRGEMNLDEVREVWASLERVPMVFYTPEDLVSRAGEITAETGVIIYDALFLALAEDAGTVMVTADGRLLRSLEGTSFARLAHSLAEVGSLVPGTD